MIIYLDIVLLENICMNYIILYATGIIYKTKMKSFRIFLSSILGGLYAVISFMGILEIYSSIFLKFILSVVMVYMAFGSKNVKILLKQLLLFYLASFVFGGVAFALLYFVKPQEILTKNGLLIGTYPIKIVSLGAIVGFFVIRTAIQFIKGKINKNDMLCNIEVHINNNFKIVTALIDTGNLLQEPITKTPVIIVEAIELEEILSNKFINNLENILKGNIPEELIEYMPKLKVIPFTSLGKENGMLVGIKPEKILIHTEEENVEIENVIVGLYDKNLAKNGLYTALIGLNILESQNDKVYKKYNLM